MCEMIGLFVERRAWFGSGRFPLYGNSVVNVEWKKWGDRKSVV